MKILKIFGVLIVSLVVLAGGGVYYAKSQGPKLAKKYVNQYGQSIGYRIDFNELKFELKNPKVDVKGLIIEKLSNKEELLKVDHLGVAMKWMPLLHKEVEITSVAIDQPVILAANLDSQWNWQTLIEAIATKAAEHPKQEQKSSKPMKFVVDELRLHNGNVIVNDLAQGFKTTIEPLNIELKNTTNVDKEGDFGGLQTQYAIQLGDVTVPLPKSDKKIHLGQVALGGDFDLDDKKDMVIKLKAKIENGILETSTHIKPEEKRIDSEIQIDRLSLVPFIDMMTPKSPLKEKSGVLSGKLHVMQKDQENALDGDLQVEKIALAPLVEMIPANSPLIGKSGEASGNFKIAHNSTENHVTGILDINQLAIFEPDNKSELLAWSAAKVTGLDVLLTPTGKKVKVDKVKVDGLVGRFTIFEDRTSNFRRLFSKEGATPPVKKEAEKQSPEKSSPSKPPEENSSIPLTKSEGSKFLQVKQVKKIAPNNPIPSEQKPSTPLDLDLKSIELTKGDIEFSDFSIRPNFKTGIHDFHGTLVGISNQPKRYASAAFDGLVDKSGDMKMRGQMAFSDPKRNHDVNLNFRKIPLSAINPYSTTFAGYEIKGGTVSVDLHYKTKDGQLLGDNRVLINQIKLGDQVPDYKGKSLPLRLAIALLEDGDGIIDLNLQVAGNIDHPEFNTGKLVWDAFLTVLTNIVSAPFRALGRLIGIENFEGVYFDPGSALLRPSEAIKLEKIANAMEKRPKVFLNIQGVYDPQVDKLQISSEKSGRQIYQRAGFKLSENEPLPEITFADERMQKALLSFYKEKVGALNSDLKLVSGAAGEEQYKLLFKEVAAKENVTDEQLKNLAQQRALATQTAMQKVSQATLGRTKLVDIKTDEAKKDGIAIGLELSSN